MLTLLYGTRAAREEILRLIQNDVKECRRAYFIVPDQKALLAENALMTALPKNAALLVDAVGFSRLANLVARRFGSLTYNYATDGAKLVTMYRTMKKLNPYLSVFANSFQGKTLEALCSLMSEFRACSVTAEDITNAADNLENESLCKKLNDLAAIYTEYEATLHEKFAEQADDIDTLALLLAENDFFGDAHIYIDSFVSFTKQELTVISRMLSRGCNVTVALPFSRRGAHMAECADTRKKLLSLSAKLSVTLEEKYLTDTSHDALVFAKENLWDLGSADTYNEPTDGRIELCVCNNKSDEIALALREIYLAVESGHSYSDIAVIARNADNYAGLIDRAFSRCNIPFFFSHKKNAALLPLTRLILSALSLYVYNFKESNVAAYIKTGLVDISDDECDEFEEYINRWNVCGRERYLDGEDFTMSTDGYTTEVDKEALSVINAVKQKIALPLSRFCDSLDGAKTVKDFATAVYEYLTEMNICEKSSDENFAKYFGTSLATESIRLWNITLAALDTMVDAAGDEKTTAAEFCDLVKLLFSAVDISEIPSSKDQIIIGNADTIRIDERKIVIILGAVEGVFPAPVSESPTLGENERKLLDGVGVTLSQNLALRSARELYHFVRAIDFATEKVIISYYLADLNGEKSEKSFAVSRIEQLFPCLKKYAYRDIPDIDKLFYTGQAAEAIGSMGKTTEALLSAVLTPRRLYTPPLTDAKLLSNAFARITPECASAFHGSRMYLSQTKLDTYSDCHLNYFLNYMLSLEDTEPFAFNPNNTGTFVHSILEHFIGTVKSSGKRLADLTDDEINTLATSLCTAEVEKIMHSQSTKSARMLCFFDRMRKNILLIAKNLVNEFKHSSFEPLELEYRIGGKEGHKPLVVSLPDGASVSLNGVADRVDIFKKDGKVYLRVADYKSGDKKFSEKDLQKGKNLQLLIYLFSLCTVADKQFFDLVGVDSTDDILPASATYFVVKPPRVELDDEARPKSTEFAEDALIRMGFVFDMDTLAHAIDSSVEQKFIKGLTAKTNEEADGLFETVKESIARIACDMRSGDITAAEKDTTCHYCAYAHICRKEKVMGEEEDNG